jgi:hypothetical protein
MLFLLEDFNAPDPDHRMPHRFSPALTCCRAQCAAGGFARVDSASGAGAKKPLLI